MIMKATASSMLTKIIGRKAAAVVVEAATSTPQVSDLAQTDQYLDTFRAIDRASNLGIPSKIRVTAMNAMVRLGDGDANGQDQLASILKESKVDDDAALRDVIMTLMTMERAHHANLANA